MSSQLCVHFMQFVTTAAVVYARLELLWIHGYYTLGPTWSCLLRAYSVP